MADDKDEKPEFDDGSSGGVPWRILLPVFQQVLDRMAPQSSIAFVVTRDELRAHFEERAAHYRSEVSEMQLGNVEKIDAHVQAVKQYQRMPGMPPIDEGRMREEVKRFQIDQAKAKGAMFDFCAKHLPGHVAAFALDLQTAEFYELIPTLPAREMMAVARGGPNLPGTLMPFA